MHISSSMTKTSAATRSKTRSMLSRCPQQISVILRLLLPSPYHHYWIMPIEIKHKHVMSFYRRPWPIITHHSLTISKNRRFDLCAVLYLCEHKVHPKVWSCIGRVLWRTNCYHKRCQHAQNKMNASGGLFLGRFGRYRLRSGVE